MKKIKDGLKWFWTELKRDFNDNYRPRFTIENFRKWRHKKAVGIRQFFTLKHLKNLALVFLYLFGQLFLIMSILGLVISACCAIVFAIKVLCTSPETKQITQDFQENYTDRMSTVTSTPDIAKADENFIKAMDFIYKDSRYAHTLATSKTQEILDWKEDMNAYGEALHEAATDPTTNKGEKMRCLETVQGKMARTYYEGIMYGNVTDTAYDIPNDLEYETPPIDNTEYLNTVGIKFVKSLIALAICGLGVFLLKKIKIPPTDDPKKASPEYDIEEA